MTEARALPDLRSRISIDTSGLQRAEMEARASGSGMSLGLGAGSQAAKDLEKDLTGLGKSAAGGIPILGSLGSSIGGLPLPALAAAAAIGGLAIAGKSIVDISDKWEAAQKSLAQATTASGVSYDKARDAVEQFIGSNRRFVSNQAEVVEGEAALIRSGLKMSEVRRDMNLALDLSALKHISLKDATEALLKAEQGRMRALIDLGIVSKSFTDAQGNLVAGMHGVAASMDAVEARVRGGRAATSDLQQSMNQLGNVWQTLAERTGPGLTKILGSVIDQFTGLLSLLSNTIGKIMDLIDWLGKIKAPSINLPFGIGGPAGRAGGGAVLPGGIYTVGERGPETLVMGGAGGTVIPSSGTAASSPMSTAGTNMRGLEQRLDAIIGLLQPPSGQTGVAAALYKAVQGAGLNRARGMSGA